MRISTHRSRRTLSSAYARIDLMAVKIAVRTFKFNVGQSIRGDWYFSINALRSVERDANRFS